MMRTTAADVRAALYDMVPGMVTEMVGRELARLADEGVRVSARRRRYIERQVERMARAYVAGIRISFVRAV